MLYSWFWVALLLLFLGFATGYVTEFSSNALTTWLWVAPVSQIGAHLALPRLTLPAALAGATTGAIIVCMNEQRVSLAGRIHESPIPGSNCRAFSMIAARAGL